MTSLTKIKQRMRTRGEILAAACDAAREFGLYDMTRAQIAKKAKTATGTVSFHYGDMETLRKEVVRQCIASPTGKNLRVLATALAAKCTVAVRAPAEVKREALNTLA